MILASGKLEDGGPVLIVGLSRGNIEHLLEGHPIHKTVVPGLDGDLIVMFGESEAVLEAAILPLGAPEPPEGA